MRGALPEPRYVYLDEEAMAYAHEVAHGRHTSGGASRPGSGGKNAIRMDLVGAMAEIAVCLYYGVPYQGQVEVLEHRPGAIPDVVIDGWKISVKGRERWGEDVDLVVQSNDTENDLYMLCSVAVDRREVALRGYCTQKELLAYEPEAWKWTTDRPGANQPEKKRRYVPLKDLRECKEREPYTSPEESLESSASEAEDRSFRAFYSESGEWTEIPLETLRKIEEELPSEAQRPEWWEEALRRLQRVEDPRPGE